MKTCDAVQERLAEVGAAAAQEDSEIATHLESCADCSAFMAQLLELDRALDGLPEEDASDALVAKTLQAVRSAQAKGAGGSGGPTINRRWVAGAMAASLVVVATGSLSVFVARSWLDSGVRAVIVTGEAPSASADSDAEQVAQLERSLSEIVDLRLSESDRTAAGKNEREGRQEAAEAGREVFRGAGEGSHSAASPLPESEVALSADTMPNAPLPSTPGTSSLRGELAGQGTGNAQGGLSNLFAESQSEPAKDIGDERNRAVGKSNDGLEPEEQLATAETFYKQPSAKPQARGDADQLFDRESELIARLQDLEGSAQFSLDELQSDKKAENKQITGGVAGAPAAAPKVGAKSKEAGAFRYGADDQFAVNEELGQRRNSDAPEDVVAAPPPAPGPDPVVSGERNSLSAVGIVRSLKTSKIEAGEGAGSLSSYDKERFRNFQTQSKAGEEVASDEVVATAPEEAPVRQAPALPVDPTEQAKRDRLKKGLMTAPNELSELRADNGVGDRSEAGAGRYYSGGMVHVGNDLSATAQAFLNRYSTLDSLAFQDPRGYWANTYIPGDPAMRLLEARLRDWNRAALGERGLLEQSVQPVAQPFDAPESAALALYLQADAAAIEGPTRMRLQIGLKGAEREGGRRPAMNIGLVVDLRTLAKDGMGPRLAALVMALEQARQPGDRFSLIAAGAGGGVIVAPEDFRYGALRVALDQLFDKRDERAGEAVSLPLAVSLATETVRQTDDPSAILGSSLVLLATGSSLAGDLPALEEMAHANAVGGIPLSVVSVGGSASLDDIDRLVAAGQGNRRVLETADKAEGLIDRELHSASRAVARALRLRVRLAPGVKLVEVLGSRKLEAPQAARVREAEQSLDRRLAQNLGIIADRGLDEEGIQIVIPSFYAGDSHVVLLDVIAENPGPVVDVRVRYKDVVYLKNGVTEASLTLNRGTTAQGPLERNVLKNLVAWEMSRQLRQVSAFLNNGQVGPAVQVIAQYRDLIAGLRRDVPGWSSDPDLAADQALLKNYLAALGSPVANDPAQRRYLAESLQLAAFRKLQAGAE